MGAVEVGRTPMQGILHVSNKCPLPVFWVRRGGGERIMVRANRYALAAAQDGVALEPAVRALHGCDNPVCVRVSWPRETGLVHVVGGSQRDNMEMMARAGRGGSRPLVRRGMVGLAQRRARAVALRRAVRDGWDAEARRVAGPRRGRRGFSRHDEAGFTAWRFMFSQNDRAPSVVETMGVAPMLDASSMSVVR